jgi:hypothetical protein
MMALRSFWPWNSSASQVREARDASRQSDVRVADADAHGIRVAHLHLDARLAAAFHQRLDEGEDDAVEVGAGAVFDVAARDDAVGEGGIDDFEVVCDDRFAVRTELLEDVVVGNRGEDAGFAQAGRADEPVVGHRAANPAGDFREAVAELLAAFDGFAILPCIEEEFRLADHSLGAAKFLEQRVEVDDLLDGVGGAALLAVAEGGVGDPDVVVRVEWDGFAFELDHRWECVRELVAVEVRPGGGGMGVGFGVGDEGSGHERPPKYNLDDCIQCQFGWACATAEREYLGHEI